MRINKLLLITGMVIFLVSCKKEMNIPENKTEVSTYSRAAYTGFPETFESGTKTAYTAADITLSTGSWNLNDALIGNSTADVKKGTKLVRIQNSGVVSMNFNVTNGAYDVSLYYAKYGTDAASTFELWASINSGSTWSKVGSTITASTTTLTQSTFTANIAGTVRFQIRKTSGGRLNIDDIVINDNNSTTPTRDDNLAMGNPSGASTNISSTNNYLMTKPQ